jgi:N-glycosylase/DNA lyase
MAGRQTVFPVRDYDLAATLDSGQTFRWRLNDGAWTGVIGGRQVRLRQTGDSIVAETAAPAVGWDWLEHYLQTGTDLAAILKTFPADPPMQAAVRACLGLRLLRQEPWECLASFILSSTKQIVQIRQIVSLLCERFGEPIPVFPGQPREFSFPGAARIAALSEVELRGCKMGFRAPYLLASARSVAAGEIHLDRLQGLPVETARAELMRLPGVGRKIADCVLLFGYGFDAAFPIDVWVVKALQQLYFPKRRAARPRLERFAATHFGPHAGYAQQYLFHFMRTKNP